MIVLATNATFLGARHALLNPKNIYLRGRELTFLRLLVKSKQSSFDWLGARVWDNPLSERLNRVNR